MRELEVAAFCGDECPHGSGQRSFGIYRSVGIGSATFIACHGCLDEIRGGKGEMVFEDADGFVLRDSSANLHVGFFSDEEEAWEAWVARVNDSLAARSA